MNILQRLPFVIFSQTYPYGQNVLPVPNIFANQMTGRATQLPASPALPNFYKMFSVAQNKPFVVAETAAFVNMCDNNKASACAQQVNPPSEYSIKQAWWEQIFNLDGSNGSESIADNFPNIKIITWFDHRKIEAEAWGNTVDWTVSINPDDIAGFTQQVKTPLVKPGQAPVKYWQFGDDLRAHFALYQKKLYSKRPKFF